MPRYAHYQLRWSEQAQAYTLFIGGQASEQAPVSAWLEQIASFSFHSRAGMHYTVRKQRVQRGNSYWYGYRRVNGRIVKCYLGRTADLTLARLEEIAHLLENPPAPRLPASQTQRETVLPPSTTPTAPSSDTKDPSPVIAHPLLLSKLSPPRPHTFLLDRSRLLALLDAGRTGHLTLLSAPAGFGKTTLVCQWMTTRRTDPDFPPVAWVSLEAGDNDPVRFWRYLITACQVFQVDLAQAHNALLDTTPQPPFLPTALETMLTILLNALARCPGNGILVLEDYHVITSPQIHATIAFFLDHLPATLHLIIITRNDPPLSLARLRASNDLYEIRTADLRFSLEEMTGLLQQALSFPLAAKTIQHLHHQLEGWGAGLHLAKLALQRTSTSAPGEQALTLFPSNNPSFQEYFVTEVLHWQPEPVQHFVLQTSILPRLTGSLCDAVTGQQDSQNLLAMLERANLFLEPLDIATSQLSTTSQQWYRYHALFSEAMRNEARHRLGEDQLHHLSTRASHWHEMHGFLHEAIDAALYAQDYERAASLIERSPEMQPSAGKIPELHTLHRWLEQFPETILKQYPALCLSYATTLLFTSTSWQPGPLILHSLEKLLQMAEQHFHAENNLAKLGEIFAFRSLLAWRQNETPQAAIYGKQALAWLPKTQQIWRGLSLSMVGKAFLESGQFQQARTTLLEAYALCVAAENHYFIQATALLLGHLFFEQGELQRASTFYRQSLSEAREREHNIGICYALTGLANLSYEWNELESAYQQAQEVIALSQAFGLEFHEVHATLIQVRVQQAQGQFTAVQQRLAALLDKMPASLPHLTQAIQAARARCALAVGDHVTMLRWASEQKLHQELSQEWEEELLLARWLRTQNKQEEARHLLERLLIGAQEMGHTRCILEIQVETTLIAIACKRKAEAQQLLMEVLAQAFTGNHVRLFLDAGENMAILLRSLLPQVAEPPLLAYLHTLLYAFPVSQSMISQELTTPFTEPLSPQEKRVLRLLAQNHSNADIARELVVSVNTVRTQVQSIYGKLDVHTRSAASEVARHLHLL